MTAGRAALLAVWPASVRVLHWTLAVSVAAATASLWRYGHLHQPAGYLALGCVLARAALGVAGDGHARFARFLRSPRATLAYLRLVVRRREPRYVGHNPLGGWMSVALMVCVGGLALTGWLYTTDWLWGDERVEQFHGGLAWTLLVLVVLHVCGVVFTSLRHRENLVRAMVDGRKRAAGEHDVA